MNAISSVHFRLSIIERYAEAFKHFRLIRFLTAFCIYSNFRCFVSVPQHAVLFK